MYLLLRLGPKKGILVGLRDVMPLSLVGVYRFLYFEKINVYTKLAWAMLIRPAVAHSYKHLILS
jgi:hypothetical protein